MGVQISNDPIQDLHVSGAWASSAALPSGYELEELVRAGGGALLLRARDGRGQRVALRVWDAGARQGGTELAFLAAARGRDLVAFVDGGVLPDGRRFVAREWIEGQELGAWARGRRPEEVGSLLVDLAVALERLHRRGFVHGDLKPENVIVDACAVPRLCDFGLARPSAELGGEPAGSYFYAAPEVLCGGHATPRSDLFAFGVLCHELFVGRRPSARELYARFPARPFLDAVGADPAEFPEWLRDLVVALTKRHPGGRPASAGVLAHTLAQRLGKALEPGTLRSAWSFPAITGRAAWARAWFDGLGQAETRPQWIRVPDHEDPRALALELRMLAAVRGLSARGVVWEQHVESIRTESEIDRRCGDSLLQVPGLLFVSCGHDTPWTRRTLVHAARRAARGERCAVLVVLAGFGAPDALFEDQGVPPIGVDAVATFLAAELEEPDERRRQALAESLVRATGGSATRLDALLAEGLQRGWILCDGPRPRLRPGELPAAHDWAVSPAPATVRLSELAVELLVALDALGDVAASDVHELLGHTAQELAPALAELAAARLVEVLATPSGHVLASTRRVAPPPSAELRSSVHRRRAAQLQARGASQADVLEQRFAAQRDPALAAEVLATCQELRARGLPEQSLARVERLERACASFGVDLGRAFPDLVGERAEAWCDLGQLELAGRWAERLEALSPDDPRQRARAELVRARVASLRHRPERALEHIQAAIALDPEHESLALAARVELEHMAGNDALVLELAERAAFAELERAGAAPRRRSYVESLVAMSALRSGRAAQARATIQRLVQEAQLQGDEFREGALRLCLATIERRAGADEEQVSAARRARAELERAGRLFERAGHPAGVAHVRVSLAGILREGGELHPAEPLLASALELRERLNDAEGAAMVRGMLGLLALERGHVRAAVEDLRAALAALSGANAARHGPLLAARLEEALARIGSAPRALDELLADESAARAEPRIGVALARACALRGEVERARQVARRTRSRALALERQAVVRDLDNLLALIAWHAGERASGQPARADVAYEPSRALESLEEQDERVLRLLARTDPFPCAEATWLAEALLDAGREDRAARLFFALAARTNDGRRARAARAKAEEVLRSASSGLDAEEAERLARSLLGAPDPWPADFSPPRREDWDGVPSHELVSLLEVSGRLLDQEDLPSLLCAIVDHALAISRAERGFLVLEQDGELRYDTAKHSLRGAIDAPGLEISVSVVRQALGSMRPLCSSNAVDDPLLGGSISVSMLELRSILCLPFCVDERLRGALYLDHRLRTQAFDLTCERLCGLLAGQAALAIRQALRRDEIQSLNERLERKVLATEADLREARRALGGTAAGEVRLVGRSPAMGRLQDTIDRAAATDIAVLVLGPSGSGKELVARALHQRSPRRDRPFVAESCATIPSSLIEAELFGHARGAFTGAHRDRSGLFERADGGTLFLDEIGEMPLEVQARLLRVLESGEFRRVGESRTRSADVRLIAATNRALAEEVRQGRFRGDLFYRLDGWRLELPPLAERMEDVPELVAHFLALEEQRCGVRRKLSPAVLTKLCGRRWPGNVRELANEVARLCALSDGDLVDPGLVRADEQAGPATESVQPLALVERRLILETLERVGGNKEEAARQLGISRSKIYQRLRQWGVGESSSQG